MKEKFSAFLAFAFYTTAAMAGTPAIKVLIVDGYSNHDWRHTTECVAALLLQSGTCEISVTTAPENDAPNYSSWRPDFESYDVVIQVCNSLGSSNSWPEQVRSDFEQFMKSGGGMYVLHGANNSFSEWPAYNEMIGLGWRNADAGDALEIVDGHVRRIPSGEGKGTNHGARRDLVVQRLGDHPITRGYPQRWKTTDVELYRYARGPARNLTVLSYGIDEETGRQWPMEWVVPYGSGKVYNGTFGHVWKDLRQPPGVQCVGWQTTLIRAIQWLAGREVAWPVPEDFPTEEAFSLRPIQLVYRSSEGWRSMFNGKNLEGWSVKCPAAERNREYWQVDSGAIECNSMDGGDHDYHWLVSDEQFDDFQLRLKFQVYQSSPGNSGVQFRSRYSPSDQKAGGAWMHGPQVDIHPPMPLRTGLIYDETWEARRWIFPSLPDWNMDVSKAPASARQTRLAYADKDPEQWNDLEIICNGTAVKTYVNGRLVTDFNGAGILDDSDHGKHQVGMMGHLALQLHRNDSLRIRFKDFWVREMH